MDVLAKGHFDILTEVGTQLCHIISVAYHEYAKSINACKHNICLEDSV